MRASSRVNTIKSLYLLQREEAESDDRAPRDDQVRATAPSTCTSTCGPTSSSTGCGRAPRRRTCAAGRCTPTANRRTTWTRQAMTSRPASRQTERRGWPRPASASPHRSGSSVSCRPEAQPLIDAWHRGVRELPDHFRAWASVPSEDADVDEAAGTCSPRTASSDSSCPATDLLTPFAWERAAPLLLAAELAGQAGVRPPGTRSRAGSWSARLPEWWAPVVGYTAQLQAAWWGWHAFDGRALFPRLRLLFACRRRARAGARRAACAARRWPYDGRPGRLRRHLRHRRACARGGRAGARHRRPRARQRPPLRRPAARSSSATRPPTRSASPTRTGCSGRRPRAGR